MLFGLRQAMAAGFTHALAMDSDGQHPAGHIGAFMAAAYKIIPGIVRIINCSGQIKTYSFTVSDLKQKLSAHNISIPVSETKLESISFKNVCFNYDEKHDALRVNVKPVVLDKSVEWLKYEFIEQREKYCVVAMQWEKLSVPFKIEVDVDNIVLASLRNELTGRKGFFPALLLQATQFCFNKNINLDEALTWSIRAINGQGGQKTYITLRNLATAYEKLNRIPEADSTMNEALLIATANQYTAYGRILITQKRIDKALEIFLANQKRYGDVSGVNNGLMSGYSAKGDFKNAIKYAEKAMAQAANDAAKKTIEGQITKLKEGKDIN